MLVKSFNCFLRFGVCPSFKRFSGSCQGKTRKFFVGGNWKMNGDKDSIKKIVSEMCVDKMDKDVEVLIAAPSCYLEYTRGVLPSRILLSAQNCYSVPKGAFTGEISPAMIKDVGACWTLIGHSERRHIFKETNEMLAKKVEHAIAEGLSVVFCVGETQEERDANKSEEVVFGQMSSVIAVIKDWSKVVVAYEPVWAIGTGKVATPEIAQDIHCKLRQFLREKVDPNTADNLRIIYGGSVTGDNSKDLAKKEDIDGFLVGGASLKPEFLGIVNSRSN